MLEQIVHYNMYMYVCMYVFNVCVCTHQRYVGHVCVVCVCVCVLVDGDH